MLIDIDVLTNLSL